MHNARILSFEMSQKISEAEMSLVFAGQGISSTGVHYDPTTGKYVYTPD